MYVSPFPKYRFFCEDGYKGKEPAPETAPEFVYAQKFNYISDDNSARTHIYPPLFLTICIYSLLYAWEGHKTKVYELESPYDIHSPSPFLSPFNRKKRGIGGKKELYKCDS